MKMIYSVCMALLMAACTNSVSIEDIGEPLFDYLANEDDSTLVSDDYRSAVVVKDITLEPILQDTINYIRELEEGRVAEHVELCRDLFTKETKECLFDINYEVRWPGFTYGGNSSVLTNQEEFYDELDQLFEYDMHVPGVEVLDSLYNIKIAHNEVVNFLSLSRSSVSRVVSLSIDATNTVDYDSYTSQADVRDDFGTSYVSEIIFGTIEYFVIKLQNISDEHYSKNDLDRALIHILNGATELSAYEKKVVYTSEIYVQFGNSSAYLPWTKVPNLNTLYDVKQYMIDTRKDISVPISLKYSQYRQPFDRDDEEFEMEVEPYYIYFAEIYFRDYYKLLMWYNSFEDVSVLEDEFIEAKKGLQDLVLEVSDPKFDLNEMPKPSDEQRYQTAYHYRRNYDYNSQKIDKD
ncbi:MAG: hypothetical protein OCC49_17570 [Fibrobacterales bacterium]